LRAVQAQLQEHIHVSLPGIVTEYDSTTQVATVQLAIQLKGQDGEYESLPPIAEVPVLWPGAAAGFLHVPLVAGDAVLVVFSEEDYSGWYETGSVSAPVVQARHDLHAVAIPGLRRRGQGFSATGGHVTVASTGNLHLGSDAATAAVALAPAVTSQLADLKTAINGWVPVPNDGGAALKAALSSWLASSSAVAATKVRAV
jgi:hypothetical protein